MPVCNTHKDYAWMHAPNQGYVTQLEGAALDKRISKTAAQCEINTRNIAKLQNMLGIEGHTYNDLREHGFLYKGM